MRTKITTFIGNKGYQLGKLNNKETDKNYTRLLQI